MDKLCKKCLKMKPLDEFYAHPQMADGHINKCKDCTKSDVRENYAAHVEYYRQYDRKRFDESGRRGACSTEASKRSSKAWSARNPEKKQAHAILDYAIKKGVIKRSNRCSECGKPGRTEGHHDDYSKPLAVQWLCKPCHAKTWKKPRYKVVQRKLGGHHKGSMLPTRA